MEASGVLRHLSLRPRIRSLRPWIRTIRFWIRRIRPDIVSPIASGTREHRSTHGKTGRRAHTSGGTRTHTTKHAHTDAHTDTPRTHHYSVIYSIVTPNSALFFMAHEQCPVFVAIECVFLLYNVFSCTLFFMAHEQCPVFVAHELRPGSLLTLPLDSGPPVRHSERERVSRGSRKFIQGIGSTEFIRLRLPFKALSRLPFKALSRLPFKALLRHPFKAPF